nr:ATP-binding protein [uncultured Roseateles sp.]
MPAIASNRPPDFQMEGLWAALGRLDRMLERAANAADAAAVPAAAGAQPEPYRGLYVTTQDVQRLVRQGPGEPWLAGHGPGAGSVEPAAPPPMPESSRFPWLQQAFGLDTIDLDIVLVALAPEVDLRYERLYAYLQDDVTRRRPTVDLVLNLLCASRDAKILARARFGPEAPLVRHRLVQLAGDAGAIGTPLLSQAIKLEEPVVRLLLGQPWLDARLRGVARFTAAPEAGEGGAADTLALSLSKALADGSGPQFYLEGESSAGQEAAAAKLAARLGQSLIVVDLVRAADPADQFATTLELLLREAHLLSAVVHLQGHDALTNAERGTLAQALAARTPAAGLVIVMSGARPCDPRFRGMASVPVAAAGFRDRRAAWTAGLRGQRIELDPRALDDLAARYPLDEAQIAAATAHAARQSALEQTTPDPAALARAARQQLSRDPGTLARKLAPLHVWNDLVLPPDAIAQLKEICRQARFRHVVFGDWGFDRKLSVGKGLSALFSGPPGTGKTMAVEVIANDLGLDLFKIDLSQVVSKYIGETEKSIDRLFLEARAGNAILFFDECDALFGKRTTVQDAHDRYANIEVAYLLQKLDEHEGLSILATNLRQNLDVAFTRRLGFIVDFPFPDEDSRRRLWESIWPPKVPRSQDLDLGFLAANFKVPGGAVKNIAVAAAFLAAEQGGELKTEHLLWAARREIEKSGRRVAGSEFGPYAARVEALARAGDRHAA